MFKISPLLSESIFLAGDIPGNAESGLYDPHLVALSVAIAILGSFVTLRLASRIQEAESRRLKSILQLGGAIAFGAAIWSMHFIGMLAYNMDMAVEYDPVLTTASFGIAAAVSFIVFQIIRRGALTWPYLCLSAALLGGAICAMHYTGMEAMVFDGDLLYRQDLFILSYIIATAAAAVALLILDRLCRKDSDIKSKCLWEMLAAVIMGFGISGMHYTGMEAAVFIPWADCRYDPNQTFDMLALAVAVTSSIIFTFTFIISQLASLNTDTVEHDQAENTGRRIFVQLSGLLSVFLVLLIGSYVFLGANLKENMTNSTRLQAAAIQRMFIASYAHHITSMIAAQANGQWDVIAANTKTAQQTARQIEANYDALLNGGTAYLDVDGDRTEKISAFEDTFIVNKITLAHAEWLEFKRQAIRLMQMDATSIANNPVYDKLNAQYTKSVFAEDEVVTAINDTIRKVNNSWAAKQEGLVVIGILTFLLTLLFARNFVVRPIENSQRKLDEHNKNLAKVVQRKTQDISEARDRLKNELALQEAILGNMMQAVITIDGDGIIQTFNKFAEEIFGYDRKEVIGKNVKMLMPDPHRRQHDAYIARYQKTGEAHIIGKDRDNMEAVRKNGDVFPIDLSVSEVANQDKKIYIGLISDISERKAREDAIIEAREQAIQANATKSEFLANISHELRTPLNSIIGMSSLMCEDADMSRESVNTATIIYRSASNLLDIVNDLLDLSKVEAKEVTLENVAFSFKELFSDIFDEMVMPASEKGLLLDQKSDKDDVEYLIGDPLRLRRVIVNLVSNAIKYTEEGNVLIEYNVTHKKGDKSKALLCFSIKDTGIGIAPENLDKVFDKFAQADASTTRRFGGTGLGLSITRDLVDLMGGEIHVESTLGEGSTFTVTIPFRVAERRDRVADQRINPSLVIDETDRAPISEARILVAEDHLMNQAFLHKLFKKWDVQNYDVYETGAEVVDAWKDKEYDLILMDCHMPEMSGYEATKAIRKAEEGTGKHIPIVALTADAMVGTKDKCLDAGMDFYVTKPVDISELQAVIGQFFAFSKRQKIKTGGDEDSPIDMDLLKNFASNDDELENLLEIFLTESSKSMKILEKNQKGGKNDAWCAAAHKLKGGAGIVGASKLRDLCDAAQSMDNSTKKVREEAFSKLQKEYERVEQAIKKKLA